MSLERTIQVNLTQSMFRPMLNAMASRIARNVSLSPTEYATMAQNAMTISNNSIDDANCCLGSIIYGISATKAGQDIDGSLSGYSKSVETNRDALAKDRDATLIAQTLGVRLENAAPIFEQLGIKTEIDAAGL